MNLWDKLESKSFSNLRKATIAFWLLIIIGFGSLIVFIANTASGDLPSFSDLENPEYDEASVIYDVQGIAYGKYYVENRELIKYEEINPHVLKALLATEDVRFESHSGVDIRALFRVALKTVLLRKESSGGGSTVTQQLAKLLYKRQSLAGMNKLQRVMSLVQTKVREWITAIKLEKSYTKEEILAMYLNKFEFINGAHGIQAAAQTYFGKDQKDLDMAEAATLVGMLQNPSLYNPVRFPENATARRNVVLKQVEKYFDLDSLVSDSIRESLVDMSNFSREAHDMGPAPYFRSELTKWLRNLFNEEGIKKADGSDYNIYTDGLKIYTTLDLTYQGYAENALEGHMKALQERYWQVWRSLNPWTHEADSFQKELRQASLDRKVKESDRYLSLHDKYLGSYKLNAQELYDGIALNENVIKTLIAVDNKRQSWSSEETQQVLKEKQGSYTKLLQNDSLFNALKSSYLALQENYPKVFNTPVEMRVFSYNKQGYETKMMSPLDSVKYHNQHMQASLLAVHPVTGHIKAWVGGPGFNYFKYDHVNSRRQVGSTIKPFVYATGISLMGVSPCQEYEDIQYTIAPGDAGFSLDKEWSPSNANGEFTGNMYNLYQGLLYSKNSITVRLIKEMGNVNVIRELLDNAGISKDATYPNGQLIVPNVPSICLGSMDLTLYEMAGAYTTFANDGIYTQPVFVSRIEDRTGKIIYSSVPETRRAINSLYNGVMVDMLKNNVGGGYGLGIESPAGGKTGTTNDYADGWFMSITPELVTGVWVGGDDKWIRFLTLEDGQGAVMAKPIVKKFLQTLEADSLSGFNSLAEFPTPPSGFLEFIDCQKYKQKSAEEEQNFEKINTREDEFEFEFEEFYGDSTGFSEEIKKDSIY